MTQLTLIPFEYLTPLQMADIYSQIRNEYWFIRAVRDAKHGRAKKVRHYRKVNKLKRRLLLAGVEHSEILEFLSCCRLKCSAKKHPFAPCKFCQQKGRGVWAA